MDICHEFVFPLLYKHPDAAIKKHQARVKLTDMVTESDPISALPGSLASDIDINYSDLRLTMLVVNVGLLIMGV